MLVSPTSWISGTIFPNIASGTSLVVQRFKTSPSNAGDAGLIPGWEAKIPGALGPKSQNIKQKGQGNKFNKGF